MKPPILVRSVITLGAVALLAGAARADDPVRGPRAAGPVDEADRNVAPATVVAPATAGTPTPQDLPPEPGLHRGGVLTDGGLGLAAAPPSAGEAAKLALGREAVEASRAAGTLRSTPSPAHVGAVSGKDAPATKEQARTGRPAAELLPHPAAGFGPFPPIQEIGPAGPTAQELAKLREREGGQER